VYRDPDTGQDHHLVIKQVNGQIDPKTGKAKKRFIQLHNPGGEPLHLGTPFEQTNWKRGAPEEFVLWDAPEVIKARDILHVEGEGVAILLNEKLKEAGLYGDMVATTSPGGAKTWQLYLAEAYRGKYVYVYPDWDQDGYDYAAAVAADSKSSGALVVKIVELDGQGPTHDAKDWLSRDGNTIEKLIEKHRFASAWTPAWKPSLWQRSKAIPTWKHGDEPPKPVSMLIPNRLTETGVNVISGQWGTGKTYIWIDIAGSVMLGIPWLGEPVYRRGGVLAFTPEGGASISMRLAALIEHKLAKIDDLVIPNKLPFERALACPTLMEDADALEVMVATALDAADRFKAEFGMPLAMIVIDTVMAAAGWDSEQNNAEAARVWAIARKLSEQTGAVVVLIDHLGKVEDRGMRGASAKEDSSDVILSCLGDRTSEGELKNLRLVIRKFRDGDRGERFGYELKLVDMGIDEHAKPLTQRVVNFDPTLPIEVVECTKKKLPESTKLMLEAVVGIVWPTPLDTLRMAHKRVYRAHGKDANGDGERTAFFKALKALDLRKYQSPEGIEMVDETI
jgi:hypothetical protein